MTKNSWPCRRRRALRAARATLTASVVVVASSATARPACAEDATTLPALLDVPTVVRLAHERRAEVAAMRARAAAAAERPEIESALPDPMVIAQVDYLAIDLHGINGSVTLEQAFPLSGVLGHRRRVAEADAERWGADTRRVALDVELEALQAFFTLAERRETPVILEDQIASTEQLLVIARAHYAAGQGMQSDVLRLENEAARFRSDRRALDAEIRAAEAMLDTVLARDLTAPIPQLEWSDDVNDPPGLDVLVAKAIANRPELAGARADRRRALAEVDVMSSMYSPMALVRVGPAYMTSDGPGVMAMIGVSVPIGRGRLRASVSEAQSMVTMRSAEISAMERSIAGNVAVARENVFAERTRLLAIRQDILPRARLVVASATGSFAAGQGSMLAVLDPSRDLLEIRVQELEARAQLSMAWAKVRRETAE